MAKITKITDQGKKFIDKVIDDGGNSLLKGNNGILPFSDDGNGESIDTEWTVNSKFNGNELTTSNLKDALIKWFEDAGEDYGLDPNVLAAQCYVESGFKLWWYDKKTTKSGINGFTMSMIYSVIVDNFSNVEPKMFDMEKASIINNLKFPLSSTSYQPTSGNKNTKNVARLNRSILHQNIINNPDVMIKAQARYMRYLSNNSAKLVSTSLFCYNRGTNFLANTYSRAIEKSKKNDTQQELTEGLNYVLKVFGVLGDTINLIKASFNKKYKPKYYSFGYNNLFITNNESDLNNYPNDNFNPYKANVVESEQYGFSVEDLEKLSIVTDDRYKFIYFPEDQYVKTQKQKTQIVLHHTVSGGNEGVGGDVKWWRDKGERIATAFIISRTGNIFQLFNTNYWASHLGITADFINKQGTTKSNVFLDQRSIGIEIDSWGGLIQGPNGGWYPTTMDRDGDKQTAEPKDNENPIQNVQLYPKGFRGFKAFEKYTNAQINAVRELILSLKNKFNDIDLTYKTDMWDIDYDDNGLSIPSKINGAWGVSKNALNGISGIWTHVSYRNDKSDCHPQPELIQMLRNLSK